MDAVVDVAQHLFDTDRPGLHLQHARRGGQLPRARRHDQQRHVGADRHRHGQSSAKQSLRAQSAHGGADGGNAGCLYAQLDQSTKLSIGDDYARHQSVHEPGQGAYYVFRNPPDLYRHHGAGAGQWQLLLSDRSGDRRRRGLQQCGDDSRRRGRSDFAVPCAKQPGRRRGPHCELSRQERYAQQHHALSIDRRRSDL